MGINEQANCFGFWTVDRAMETGVCVTAAQGKKDRKTHVLDCVGRESGMFVVKCFWRGDIEEEKGQ